MMSGINGVDSPEKQFHLFRSLSELKQESKGGYIDTEFKVPHGTKTVELGLYFISIQIILWYFLSHRKHITKKVEANVFDPCIAF